MHLVRHFPSIGHSVGLYRDDGLAVIENANGLLLDRLRKKIIALFKDEELSITIETNLSVTDFLDVTLDLSRGKYYPYRKPNDKPLYINASSNQPPMILKQLPRMINRRISDLSCTQEEFEKAKSTCETALRTTGTTPPCNMKAIPTQAAIATGIEKGKSYGLTLHTTNRSKLTSESFSYDSLRSTSQGTRSSIEFSTPTLSN